MNHIKQFEEFVQNTPIGVDESEIETVEIDETVDSEEDQEETEDEETEE
jgi:hypothetical protein